MMKERNLQINQAAENLIYIQGLMNETANMTYEQGENLEVIG